MTDTVAQTAQILKYLKQGHTITPLEALHRFRCFRLAARVKNLRDDGHNVVTTIVNDGEKRYAEYSLERKAA